MLTATSCTIWLRTPMKMSARPSRAALRGVFCLELLSLNFERAREFLEFNLRGHKSAKHSRNLRRANLPRAKGHILHIENSFEEGATTNHADALPRSLESFASLIQPRTTHHRGRRHLHRQQLILQMKGTSNVPQASLEARAASDQSFIACDSVKLSCKVWCRQRGERHSWSACKCGAWRRPAVQQGLSHPYMSRQESVIM